MARSGLVLLLLALCGAALVRSDPDTPAAPAADPAAVQLEPDAEGTAGGDTEARFFFKRRRYNRRYPNYYPDYYPDNNGGYDQCDSCGYGAVDYTTARRCCQQGYSRCCFDNGGGTIKPGTCPYQGQTSVGNLYCRSECTSDGDCYGSQKCCSRGCSRTCQYPDTGSDYEKPGSCPYYGGSSGGYPSFPYYSGGSSVGGSYCRRDCYRDRDCPGSQKCCESNCSATCVTPQRYY